MTAQPQRRAVGEGVAPAARLAVVALLPGQARAAVGHGAVGVVLVVVRAIRRATHEAHPHALRNGATAAWPVARIALDAAVGEVDAEDGGVVVHRGGDVGGRRPELHVEEASALGVGELERARVDEGPRLRGGRCEPAAEVDQRVQLLDGGHAPVGVAAGAQGRGGGARLVPRHRSGEGAGPAQAGHRVGDGAVGVELERRARTGLLPVLAEERSARARAVDARVVGEAPFLRGAGHAPGGRVRGWRRGAGAGVLAGGTAGGQQQRHKASDPALADTSAARSLLSAGSRGAARGGPAATA